MLLVDELNRITGNCNVSPVSRVRFWGTSSVEHVAPVGQLEQPISAKNAIVRTYRATFINILVVCCSFISFSQNRFQLSWLVFFCGWLICQKLYPMQIAICQFNPTIGAISQNIERILAFAEQAHAQKAELIVFPELALCGYPPKDLVFLPDFMDACEAGLLKLAQQSPISILIGAPTRERFNAAYLCAAGKVSLVAKKKLLPNYQVFDEQRYFKPGSPQDSNVLELDGLKIGVTICEDAWSEVVGYEQDPVLDLVQKHQANILVNMTASPFELGKTQQREDMFCDLARKHQKPFLVAGQVGANDGLIFDGGSLWIDAQGQVLWRAKSFEEELQVLSC